MANFSEEEGESLEDLSKLAKPSEIISSLSSTVKLVRRAPGDDPNQGREPDESNLTIPVTVLRGREGLS